MKIEIWSDYVCPFCYIGKRQVELAIEKTGYKGQVQVVYKSFLLDPTTPVHAEDSIYNALSRKYGMSLAEAKSMTKNIAERAKEVGLEYNFDEMKTANTKAAHRLAKLAYDEGKAEKYNERLLQAYFLEGEAIGLEKVLERLAIEVGLSKQRVQEVLKSDEYEEKVEKDIYEAQQLGIRGVPFFVVDNKFGISGAQPQSVFEQTIEKAASEAGLKKTLNMVGDKGVICTDTQCEM